MKVLLIEVRLKKLNSTAIWAFVLSPALVIVGCRNHCRYLFVDTLQYMVFTYKEPTAGAIMTSVCTGPQEHINWSLPRYCDV